MKSSFWRFNWKILHLAKKFSLTSGINGCDKYQVCQAPFRNHFNVIAIGILFLHTHKKSFLKPKNSLKSAYMVHLKCL